MQPTTFPLDPLVSLTLAALLASGSPAIASTGTLVAQSGKHFTLDQLRGSPVVITFIAARCRDACPLIDAQIASAAHDVRASMHNVRFLTITLDPRHDSRAIMQHIAHEFDAREPRWIVATESSSTLAALTRRFGVVAQDDADGIPDMHTTFVYILDDRGRLQRTLLASANLSSDIFSAVAQL